MVYELGDGLWAGAYPDAQSIRELLDRGVKTFVNLTRRDEEWWGAIRSYQSMLPVGVNAVRYPLWTFFLPPPRKLIPLAKEIRSRAPVYLHCRHGLDRTGVMACLILMAEGLSSDEAVGRLQVLRSGLPARSPRRAYHFGYLKRAEAFRNELEPG
jgi:protein tyrosine/serine phosphatase